MADANPPARKSRKTLIASLAAGATMAVGAAAVALGPGAPWIVDHLGDGVKVWRLGRLQIDGVSGTNIANLSAARVALADERGVWAEARNVSLDWNPLALVSGEIRLLHANAETLQVLRKAELTAPGPRKATKINVALDDIRVRRLEVAEAVYGEAAVFGARLKLNIRDQAPTLIDANVERLDSNADRAIVAYRQGPDFLLYVDVASEPGAVIARMLGEETQGVYVSATGAGGENAGQAFGDIVIGRRQIAIGRLSWTPQQWGFDTQADLTALPAFAGVRKRFGDSAHIAGAGARRGAFRAQIDTPYLDVMLNGTLAEGLKLDGPAQVRAETARISDIAPEAPFEFGAGSFEGEYQVRDGRHMLAGVLDARDLNVIGRSVHMRGPVQAELNAERFVFTGDLRATEDAPPLFEDARLTADFHVQRGDTRFSLTRARLEGAAIDIDASGWARPGDGELSGSWRLKSLPAFLNWGPSGAARGRWTAHGDPVSRLWSAAIEGQASGVSGEPDTVVQLLGASPSLDGSFRFGGAGIEVVHARIDGAKARAGARGRISGGVANLALEVSARGPLRVGGVAIDGAADATGRLNGAITRPSVILNAKLATLDISAVRLDAPEIDFALAPDGDVYRGAVTARGAYRGLAFDASSDVDVEGGAFAMPNLRAALGELEAIGEAQFTSEGLTARLALNGGIDGLAPDTTGALIGDLAISPEGLRLNADLSDARFGTLRVREARLGASGPFDALAAQVEMRGALNRAPLSLTGTAQLLSPREGMELRFDGSGALAGERIATRTPIRVQWGERTYSASLDVTVGDGAVRADWSEGRREISGALRLEDAPIAPLAAIWGERAVGRVDGSAQISGDGGLTGGADFNLIDARFATRTRGALSGHVVADLKPNRLTARVDARSADGLTAHFEADAPVETSAAPLRIARVRERPGQASWSINGPVEGLWAALRLPDQALTGAVQGEGQLSFGAGQLTGDGRIALVNGTFEDKVSGVKLRDIDAVVGIGADGVTVQRFTANDSRGGRLSATGGSANPSQGHVSIRADDVRLVDRSDARMRASGDLRLSWEGLDSKLSGELQVAEGEVNVAQNPEAGIPVIEVVEINKPGDEDVIEAPEPHANGSTALDVRIVAPGRVYTRGRGLDAEWALDLRLAGTAANPRVFGEARAVRGTLSISGQAFDIQNGIITFNGAPEDARIDLTAERETVDLTARIVLAGTASNPTIEFQSDPALPEDEILPQVLFGRGVADLSALEAAQLASSLAALSGQASFDLADAARAAAGLDRLTVREDADNGGLLVAGGVYLTRDVYVEVARTGLGQAATRVEWQVRPQLVLITSFLPNGDRRASIRWRRESD